MFVAVLKTPATTVGHKIRGRCGKSSLLLSELCCESIPISDGKLVHRFGPLPGRSAPVCGNVLQRHPDQLGGGLITREVASGFDDLTQPRIHALDRIGRIDHATNRRGKGEERNDPIPSATPQRRDGRIPFAPGAALERLQGRSALVAV